MGKETKTIPYIVNIILAVMVVLSVLAGVIKIFTGFDIDEAYALAMPYRVTQGDRLFADMWEVHQTSFLLPYLFMEPYGVLKGSPDGVVVYSRIVSTLLHLAVSFLVYKQVKNLFPKSKERENVMYATQFALLLALIYFNFLPKWMINMDFSMQQIWFFTLFICCFMKKRPVSFFFAGIFLALDVLAYPGMVAVYVAAILLIWLQKEERWKRIGMLTAGCGVSALVFFVTVFCYMSPKALVEAIPMIFMDGSHQYDMATKLGVYAAQWAEVLAQTVILLIPTIIGAVLISYIYRRLHLQERYGTISKTLFFCVLFELFVSGLISVAGLVTAWGPFRLQVRYIIQFVMAFLLFRVWDKERSGPCDEAGQTAREFIKTTLWFTLAAYVGILFASNVGPVSSASYLIPGNMVFVALTLRMADGKGVFIRRLSFACAAVFLLSLILCKGFYMRNIEYVPGDITDPLAKVEQGPLAGVWVPQADYERYTADYETIQAETAENDRVLFLGTEALSNLYAKGKIVSPTTISTPAFNEQWVDYFEQNPDKMPTVIFLAKNTVDDRDKFFAKNVFGIWIAQYYDVECMEETDTLCIIRLK